MTATCRTRAQAVALFAVAVGLTTLSLTACGSSTPTTAAPPASTQTTIAATPQASSGSQIAMAGSSPISTLPSTTQQSGGTQAQVSATGAADLATKGLHRDQNRRAFKSLTLLIEVHPEDASRQTYQQDIAAENVPAVPLAGIGDSAVWTAVSLTPRRLDCRIGSLSPQGPDRLRGPRKRTKADYPHGTRRGPAITKASAAAFTAWLGILCNEVIAGLA